MEDRESSDEKTSVEEIHPLTGKWQVIYVDENLGDWPDILSCNTIQFFSDNTGYAEVTEEQYITNAKWKKINEILIEQNIKLEPFTKESVNSWIEQHNNMVETELANYVLKTKGITLENWMKNLKEEYVEYQYGEPYIYWVMKDNILITADENVKLSNTEKDELIKLLEENLNDDTGLRCEFTSNANTAYLYDRNNSLYMVLNKIK